MKDRKSTAEPVRYGLVGFGRFCQNRLIPAFRQISGSTAVAIYKRDPNAAVQAANEFGIPVGYGNLEDLCSDPAVEAVYVTSANCDHEDHAISAARAGKHVLCEKPLATTAGGCRHIIDACRQSNVLLMAAHTLRFSPAVLRLKSWITEGKLGKIIRASATFHYDGKNSPRSWLYDRRIAGGGALIDIGVHCLDTLRFLLGEVEDFRVFLHPVPDQKTVEHSAEVALRFQTGVLGDIFCSYQIPYHSRLEILGERGRAYLEPFSIAWAKSKLCLETAEESDSLEMETGNAYGELIESFSRAIRGLEPIAIPGEEGLVNQEIIDAIYGSKE